MISRWTRFSGPTCFATTVNTNHVGLAAVSCHVDLRGADPGQVLYRVVDAPAQQQRTTGIFPTDQNWSGSAWFVPLQGADIVLAGEDAWTMPLVPAAEYCFELEFMDTRTGVPFGVRQCEPDPGYPPVEVPVEQVGYYQLALLYHCEVPPAGYESEWCSANRSFYEGTCLDDEADTTVVVQRCEAYDELCQYEPGRPAHSAPEPGPEPDPGCGCRMAAGPPRTDPRWHLGLLALLAVAVLHRRAGAVRGAEW